MVRGCRLPFNLHQRSQFKNCITEMCSGSEAGSYSRLIDFVSLNSRLESHKEREEKYRRGLAFKAHSPVRWKGYLESRRCSRDTYPESYIIKYTGIRR